MAIAMWCVGWFGVDYDVEVNVLDPFGVNGKWGGNREWVNGSMQKRVQRIYWNLVGSQLWVILEFFLSMLLSLYWLRSHLWGFCV
jgi:hypothetical protein